MRVSVLGPLVIDGGRASLSRRDRVVLTALAVHEGEVVSGEQLADALWGDAIPPSWNKVVQGCIVRLRKALGPGSIDTDAHGYRLVIPPDAIDARQFERSLSRARELLAFGEHERAMFAADEALALWRGRPLLDSLEWEPARIEIERLEELHHEAEEVRLDAALRAGLHGEVLATARSLVEAAPTRERRWELLALAQYRSGSQGDALRTLHTARRVLADELGVDPGPDLQALERAVLDQAPELQGPGAPPDVGTWCPWPGLLAYGIDDAEGFFGRGSEVEACLERLAAGGVVVVVGASGSGKSSLGQSAGIAARLQRNGQRVVIVVPGARPVDALSTLPASGEPPVLVIDQCEEVVTLCHEPARRTEFLDALVSHARSAPLLVTLRADHLADLSSHTEFAALVERGLFLLGPMGEAELRTAVEGPAGRAGLRVEPGLVDLVVREIQAEPGALPLLSHALHQTWTHREGRTMTVAGFRAAGGIAGAVAQSAERVYVESGDAERAKLRELLVRLVVPAENGDPARVRLARDVVAGDPGYEQLVERLVAARLVTSDDQVVELAHEAVARAWPRLRGWLEEDVEGASVLRHLTSAASGWDALGRPSGELYRGPRLAQARAWHERATADLTPVERAFLDASIAGEDAELTAARDQVRHERQTNRRLRWLVGVAALLTVLAVVVSSLAIREGQRADDEATVAEARRLAAEALSARPQDRALLLALEAVRRSDSPETRGNLLTTINRSPNLTGVIRSPGPRLLDLEITSDGERAAVTDAVGGLTIFDLSAREETAAFRADGRTYNAPAFSPDGRQIATAEVPNECFGGPCDAIDVVVFDSDDPEAPTTTYTGARQVVVDLAYSNHGDLLASVPSFHWANDGANITVWRVGEPERPYRRLELPNSGVELRLTPDLPSPGWVAFSPDGSHLYASGAGPTAQFDLVTGALVREVGGRGGLALSPDGHLLAVRTVAGGVQLVDTRTGETRAEIPGDSGAVTAAAFSADGRTVATASTDETITLWDASSGDRLQGLEGHAGAVLDVGFAGPSSRVHSIAADRGIFEWDPDGTPLARQLVDGSVATRTEGVVLVSPAADSIVLGSSSLLRVDVGTGGLKTLEEGRDLDLSWAAYSPDGGRVTAVELNGATSLWDVDSGDLLARTEGRGALNFGAIAFAPDGHILVADADGTVVELDGETLSPTGRTVDVGVEPAGIRATVGGVFAVTSYPSVDPADGTDIAFGKLDEGRLTSQTHVEHWGLRANFDADGRHYAFGGFDGHVGVVEVASGKVRGPSDPVHSGPVGWVAFSPDGTTLASLGAGGELVLSVADTAAPQARSRPGPVKFPGGSMSFSPDGKTVVIGYVDGGVVAYDIDPDSWVDHACRVAGRNLTEAEWRDAFGDGAPHATCRS